MRSTRRRRWCWSIGRSIGGLWPTSDRVHRRTASAGLVLPDCLLYIQRPRGCVMEADLRVVSPSNRAADVASGAMRREAAVSKDLVGAERLWMGYVELDGGGVSAGAPHREAG